MTKTVYIISDIDKALAFEWITRHIDKNKVQLSFILILQKSAVLEGFLQKQAIPCYTYYYRGKKNLVKILCQVVKRLMQLKPQVVHCHLLYGSLIGLTAARLAGVKQRIYTRHHSDYHQRYFPKGIKWDKWCNKMATKIVAPCEAVKEVLVKYEQVPEEKVTVVHHGFNLDYFQEVNVERIERLKEKYEIGEHQPVIGVISRFTELKGIQFIIPAFKKLLIHYPNALLLLFNARGDYEKAIKEQLESSLPEMNYRIISFENDLATVYRLFDVFVQASTDRTIEAFGQTYVEALASGIPSVFTLSGIANDFIVDRQNALVVPFESSQAIYKAIEELMSNNLLRKRLIEKGLESVRKKFTIEQMIQKLEILYAGN